jgi:hypothetical protein
MTQTFFEYAANRFINMAQIKEIEYHTNTGTVYAQDNRRGRVDGVRAVRG